MWTSAGSAKAVVKASKVLMPVTPKYYITQEQLETLDDKAFVRAAYRRFVRLRPFVSKRQMIKDSYTTYLRYKFKVEDYEDKRKKILPSTSTAAPFRESVRNSLQFLMKGFSTCETFSDDMKDECHLCKRIFKNILTVEYHKTRNIHRSSKLYEQYRKDFTYLGDIQFAGLKHFEETLMRLNDCLRTRL